MIPEVSIESRFEVTHQPNGEKTSAMSLLTDGRSRPGARQSKIREAYLRGQHYKRSNLRYAETETTHDLSHTQTQRRLVQLFFVFFVGCSKLSPAVYFFFLSLSLSPIYGVSAVSHVFQ